MSEAAQAVPDRHGERREAIQFLARCSMDCFVASLLAMTSES
jgi:hypothetical protein